MSGPDAQPEPLGMKGGADFLIEYATPDIYRVNSFRVLGLPVDATPRDIAHRAEKLKLIEKFGDGSQRAKGPMPLDPTPDAYAIREALQRLRDPEHRLVDEFFWFWPSRVGRGDQDEALRALAGGSVKEAVDIWRDQEEKYSESKVSTHNLAILYHASALDLEYIHLTKGLSETQRQHRDSYWLSALKRWRLLLHEEGFWSRLAARIRELDDPRLTTGTARRLRSALPLALLSINAQLAVRAAERPDGAEASIQTYLVRESGFDREVGNEALRRAVQSIRSRIRALCQGAEEETAVQPAYADRTVRKLVRQTRPLLAIFVSLFAEGNPSRDGTHDEVALQVWSCVIAFAKQTSNWKVCSELLELASSIAMSAPVRERIGQDLAVVGRNRENEILDVHLAPFVAEIERVLGSKDMPAAKFRQLREKLIPRLDGIIRQTPGIPKIHATAAEFLAGAFRSVAIDLHNNFNDFALAQEALQVARNISPDGELRQQIEKDLETVGGHVVQQAVRIPSQGNGGTAIAWIVVIGIILLLGALKDCSTKNSGIISEPSLSSPNSSTPRSTRSSDSSTEIQAPRRGPRTPSPSRDFSEVEKLKRTIDIERIFLKAEESELASMGATLDSHRNQIAEYRDMLERFERQSRLGYAVNETQYESVRRLHNSLVGTHNELLVRSRERYAAYELRLAQLNEKIARYNRMIGAR